MKHIKLTIFLTSFTILCYEIILTRIFTITQWQNLSSLIICLALLGFGASGTFLVIFRKVISRNLDFFIWFLLLLYPVTLISGFIIFCKIPFNPFEIGINNLQVWNFFFQFLVLGIPFFLGANVIGIALTKFPTGKIYFSNLVGSGFGAIFVILVSFILHPFLILTVIISISFLCLIIFSINLKKKILLLSILISILLITLFAYSFDHLNLKQISQYKSISRTLNLPEAKILEERYSPLGLVQVVEAKGFRSTIGLSLVSPFEIPEQKGIFFDGSSVSPITPFAGNKSKIEYLNYLPSILPYVLLENYRKEKALIVGVGGGEGILKAILHDFKGIQGLEINRDVINLMKNEFSEFSGNIYNLPNVRIINKEARGFIKTSQEKYNLIEISMLDAFNTASAGTSSMNESYLYTVESIKDFYEHLEDNGILAISRWILTPPRDNLKMLNTCARALRDLEIENIKKHIIFIRSMQAATLIISKKQFSEKQIANTKSFCNSKLFNIIYYEGISENEVNRFIKLEEPLYYRAAENILSGTDKNFITDYDFEIKAATDNKPYFYNFFKPKLLKQISQFGVSKIPFTEWGYLILILLLIPVILISSVFIILPLIFIKSSEKRLNLKIIFYFGLLGIGFFFIEMPLIQKLVLFLSHPTYSLSVIISGLLLFSGLGSYFSDRIFKEKNRILFASLLVSFIILIYLGFFKYLLPELIQLNIFFKILITILLLMPLGFFMGIPFPQAVNFLKRINQSKVPWAWGINGFFSVISILSATICAIVFGFNIVFLVACVCYLAVGILSLQFQS